MDQIESSFSLRVNMTSSAFSAAQGGNFIYCNRAVDWKLVVEGALIVEKGVSIVLDRGTIQLQGALHCTGIRCACFSRKGIRSILTLVELCLLYAAE